MLLVDLILNAATALATLALGAMLLFAGVVTPAAFAALGREGAGRYMRVLFPRYYLVLAVVCASAALLALAAVATAPDASPKPIWPLPAAAGLAAAGFVFARQVLAPRLDARRDAMLAGDTAAGQAFKRLHRGSVLLNLAQMLALTAAIAWTLFG
jgi:hypothetical protein